MKVLHYLCIPINPKNLIPRLFEDEKKTTYAMLGLGIIGGLYSITVYVGYQNGFGAVAKPFLAIPPEKYYLWETFFCLPAFITIAVVFAGFARLIAGWFGGAGTFDNMFAMYGLSMIIPMLLTMWLPEALLMVAFPNARSMPLGGFRIWPSSVDNIRQTVGILWPLMITTVGIMKSERISLARSATVSLLAFIPTGALIFLLIR